MTVKEIYLPNAHEFLIIIDDSTREKALRTQYFQNKKKTIWLDFGELGRVAL